MTDVGRQFLVALNRNLTDSDALDGELPENLREAAELNNGALADLLTEPTTASRALVSDADGKVAPSVVTATELGYLDGVTSAIQTQINSLDSEKLDFSLSPTFADRAVAAATNVGGGVSFLEVQSYSQSSDPSRGKARYRLAEDDAEYAAFPSRLRITTADGLKFVIAEPIITLEMAGAVGDGVTNDQDAYDDARAYGRPIQLVAGKTYLVTDPSNSDGIPLIGQGKLVTAVTGGLRQRNSYADSTRIAWGHEYLDRPFQFMNLGQNSSSGTFRVHLFGDSTVEGGYGEYQTVQAVISAALKRAGIPNHTITNHGAAGTDWSDLDLSGTIGTTVGLIIIKYNINDAGNGLATTITNIRTELAATRAATNGGVGTTPILIVSGSGTSDSPNNRDERWYESLNGVVRQAARDYQCAFFDGYAFMRDARGAAGIWLDNPYADGRAIHPINGTNARFWGAVMDEFFPPYALAAYANNLFTNEGATTSSVAVSVAPNNFNYGQYSYRATTGNGWPIDGVVFGVRNADGPHVQFLHGYGTDSNRVLVRTAATAGNTWNQWAGQATSLTLANSWVNYGGALGTPKATLNMSGLVKVQGTIKNGTVTGGTVLTTLPAGLRPEADLLFVCSVYSSTDHATIRVKTNGNIVGENGLNASLTSLDNISFMAA